MAAGMGSRYGGLKQIDPVDPRDISLWIFPCMTRKRPDLRRLYLSSKRKMKKISGRESATESADHGSFLCVPGSQQYSGRLSGSGGKGKPWGTGHAVLSCLGCVDAPFAVINADDYYGSHAFQVIYDFLTTHQDDEKYHYTMVGYILENTLTENGHVARGVCETDENGYLVDIHERTHIERRGDVTAYTEDDGATWTEIPEGSTVSMNMWGFTESMLTELKNRLGFLRMP